MPKIDCKHWRDCDHPHGGCCAVFDAPVSRGVCAGCDQRAPAPVPPEAVTISARPASPTVKDKGSARRVVQVGRQVLKGAAGMLQAAVGHDQADEATRAARLAICASCELSQPQDKPVEKRRCGKLLDVLKADTSGGAACGCGLASKTKLRGQACPLGKWGTDGGTSGGVNAPGPG